jgi:hypothetical protein
MYEFLEETVEHNMTSPAKAVAPEMTAGDLLPCSPPTIWTLIRSSAMESWSVSFPRPMP